MNWSCCKSLNVLFLSLQNKELYKLLSGKPSFHILSEFQNQETMHWSDLSFHLGLFPYFPVSHFLNSIQHIFYGQWYFTSPIMACVSVSIGDTHCA